MVGQLVTEAKRHRTSSRGEVPSGSAHHDPHSRRVLILTAEIGAGHLSSALAFKAHLESEDPDAQVTIDEPLRRTPAFAKLPRLYRFMTAYLPTVWAAFYYSRRFKLVRHVYGRFIRWRLHPALADLGLEQYDTIVLTYSMFCNCIDSFTGAGLRTVVLVTDLFGGPNEWFCPGADSYIVPTDHMAAMARASEIAPDRIQLRRLPTLMPNVPPRPTWRADQSSKLHILIIGGSEGLGPLKATAIGMLRSQRDTSVTVVCGNNARLRRRLLGLSIRSYGFVPEVARTYRNYDIVVTKPGSVTMMELFEQNVPFILLPGIPGIEAGNTNMIRRLGLPRIRHARAARTTPKTLVNTDLSLSEAGVRWIETLTQTQATLPQRYSTIDEISPVYRISRRAA